jgi:hypothetical protein
MLTKTLQYVQKFSTYKNKEAIAQAKELLQRDGKYEDFTQFEVASLNNLNIMTVDEALILVPSLRNLSERIARRRGLADVHAGNIETHQLIDDLLEDLKRFQNA